VPPSQVKVLDGHAPLPDGLVRYETADRRDEIYVAPGFPTAAQPHLRIGRLAVQPSTVTYHMPDDWLERLVAEAAAHGANTVLVLAKGVVVAVRLSSASPPRAPADELVSQGMTSLPKYRAASTMTIQLDHVAPIHLTARKGTCYAVVMALDARAEWSADVRDAGLAEALVATKGWLASAEPATFVPPRTAIAPRSTASELTCALGDTEMQLRFRTPRSSSALGSLGVGTARLVVLERTMSEDALAARTQTELMAYMFTGPSYSDAELGERDCVVCAGAMGACRMYQIQACEPLQDCLDARGHRTRVSYCLRER